MKTAFLMMVSACAALSAAEPPSGRPLQAEMLQTTTVKAVAPTGFAHGKVTLKKGKVFPVVERRRNVVVLETGGGRVRVSPAEVKVSQRTAALTASAAGASAAKP